MPMSIRFLCTAGAPPPHPRPSLEEQQRNLSLTLAGALLGRAPTGLHHAGRGRQLRANG